MEDTVRRLAKHLGASSVEGTGHGASFMIEDGQGAQLRLNIEGTGQRVMAVLDDPDGTTRCSLDLAPVSEAFEDADFPGRVNLRVGNQLVHIDSQPSLGIEVESIAVDQRTRSQRLASRAP